MIKSKRHDTQTVIRININESYKIKIKIISMSIPAKNIKSKKRKE